MTAYARQLRKPEPFWAGDVLVVGGGLSGILTALNLRREGLDVALLERTGFGADQSNHSHGYLHRGYIYRNVSARMIESFTEAAGLWDEIIDPTGITPVTPTSSICFTDATNALAAEARWKRAGLEIRESECPPWFNARKVVRSYTTPEPSYDFTDILRALARSLDAEGVTTIQGDARRLHRHNERMRIASVEAVTGTHRVLLQAKSFVLCAGVGNVELLHTVTSFLGKAQIRTSFMLVLEKEGLPLASAIFPENEMYGLFLVARPGANGPNVWLISNFISYGGAIHDQKADGCWVRAAYNGVHSIYRDVEGSRFQFYRANKMELRADPHQLSTHAIETYAFDNLLTVAPTKLTLTPLLARDVAIRVRDILEHVDVWARAKEYPRHHNLAVQQERWRDVKLLPFEKLGEVGRPSRMKKIASTAKVGASTVSDRLRSPASPGS